MGVDENVSSLKKIIKFLALFMAVFHIYAIQFIPFPVDLLKNFHLLFALSIFYLMQIDEHRGNKLLTLLDISLLVMCLSSTIYIWIFFVDLNEMMGLIELPAVIFGLFLLIGVWESTRRKWGYIIPIFVLISLVYASFGYLLPHPFYHSGISFDRLMGYSSMFFRGMLGSITTLSASVVYILFIFVGLLEALGGDQMFLRLGQNMAAKFRSGPAQSAVVCSALMGMLSGSTAANVATTGSFTIPMMKSVGYKPGYAGAIECVASTGGQITPPIMGAAAFLIVALTGIPYAQIVIAAILPAIIYYFYIGLSVELRARKDNIDASIKGKQESNLLIITENLNLILPIFILVYYLLKQYSAGLSAIYASYGLIGFTIIKNVFFSKDNKIESFKRTFRDIINGLEKASMQAVAIVAFFACVNIAVEMLIVTGLAQKFSSIMLNMAGGSLLILLILTAITSIIFGMGMPTPGAYILVALLGAPAIVEAGSSLLVAHMFVLYYAVLSCVIPPVAVAPMVACGIAETDFWDVALKALRLALPAFILPFYFVYRPEILLSANTNLLDAFYAFVFAFVAMIGISIAFEGYFIRSLKMVERVVLGILAVLLIDPGFLTSVIGLVGLFGSLVFIYFSSKYSKNKLEPHMKNY